MAICIRCTVCTSDYKLGLRSCPNCGNTNPKSRKYKVICKLPNGKWKTKTVSSLDLAYRVEAKIKTQIVELEVFDIQSKAPAIDEVWNLYLKWAKVNKKTWPDDEIRWAKHISPSLGSIKMNQITPQDVDKILNNMRVKVSHKGKPYQPATIKQVLILLKGVFNWSKRQGLYKGLNPCDNVSVPKFDNRVNNTLTKKDLKNFLAYLDDGACTNERAALVVKFALYSGRRRGEILSLQWTDLDLENDLITFSGMNTKNSESQTVPINNRCREIIDRCQEIANCEYVFPSSKGGYYGGFIIAWKRMREKAGLSIRFHDLRHTFASYLASSGEVDIFTLKDLLGHKSLSMTERYAHLINGALRRGVEVADRVF